jgi:hypothetical protein
MEKVIIMTALLITSFVILLSYIIYAGVAESLSATYYKVKKPYLFSDSVRSNRFPDDDLPA